MIRARSRLDGLRWLILFMPLLPVIAAFALIPEDAVAFISWWLFLTVPGWLFLPLANRFFHLSPDRGYLLAKPLALLLPALAVWTLSYLHLLPFRSIVILTVLTVGAVLVHLSRSNLLFWRDILRKPDVFVWWAAEETMLGGTFLFWTFARGLSPALDSLEKFMDYGFMMSLWRTDFLPAKDMWLSGSPINYYYFGQYLMAYWAKATGVHPEKAYNLAMAILFALTFCLSFAVALLIGSRLQKTEIRASRIFPVAFASVTAVLTTLGGNGHVFYYGGSAIGRWLHSLFSRFGLTVGTIGKSYWFADATRYIGYNPDTTDKTIHEFPYYSFLVSDLHAHVVSLIPVFLTLAVLAVILFRRSEQPIRIAGFEIDPLFVLLSALLAIFMMGNYWDFVIYFAVTCLVLLVRESQDDAAIRKKASLVAAGSPGNPGSSGNSVGSGSSGNQGIMDTPGTPYSPRSRFFWTGALLTVVQAGALMLPFMLFQNVFAAILAYGFAAILSWMIATRFRHPMTATGAKACSLFLLAHLFALPFNANFEPIAKTIRRTVSQTPLIQLWILYGFLILAGLVFVIDIMRERHDARVCQVSLFDRSRYAEPCRPNESAITLADRLILVFLICGLGLILIPELVYVVDIYSGDYKRANTMFKFTYQAFVLLSLVLSYAPLRVLLLRSRKKESLRRSIAGALLLLLYVPTLLYPLKVTTQWLGDFAPERYQGIDGIRSFARKDSPNIPGAAVGELADDYAAVQWFNEHVQGQPVILESFGDSYTDFCRISAYTGLPTVMGWQTHEWLWRTSRATPDAYQSVVVPRQNDVRLLYTSRDEQIVRHLLSQYRVQYIIIGNLERQKFPVIGTDGKPTGQTLVNETLLKSLGTIVFQSGSLFIVGIKQ